METDWRSKGRLVSIGGQKVITKIDWIDWMVDWYPTGSRLVCMTGVDWWLKPVTES
jgi:hypothetical protein